MNRELHRMNAECSKQQRNIDATRDPQVRVTIATESANWCQHNMGVIQIAYQGTVDGYWRLYRMWFGQPPVNATEHEIDDQVREARHYSFGRIAFLAVESLAAAILAIMFFAAPPVIGAVIGIGLALLLGAAAAAGGTRWIRHDAAMQPDKQLERVSRGLLWCGIPWLISVVAALSVLRSEASSWGSALFLGMTTAVTLLSPLCSGLCTYAADLLFWSSRLCTNLRWLRALEGRVKKLGNVSQRSLPPAPSNIVTHDRQLLLKSAMPFAIMAAIMWASNLHAADLPVYVYTDISPSIRFVEVSNVLKDLSLRLEQYEGPNTLVVTLVPFYSDAYSAPSIVRIRVTPAANPKCDETVALTELARISKTYVEAAKKTASAKCEVGRNQTRIEALKQRKDEISKLNAAIQRLAEMKLGGHCTAVNAMLRRASQETPAGFSILISDLENNCPPLTLPASMPSRNRLFIIAVGSRTRPVEQWFDSAQSHFARIMPSARLLESFNLDNIFQAISGGAKLAQVQ